VTAHTVRLAEVTTRIGSGITPRGGRAVYKTSGRPFVRSQNVGWGNLRLTELAYIDDATHMRFPATEIRSGDILLNITGASIGRSAVAIPELAGGNVSQHVCEIRLKPGAMDPHFVNAVLGSRIGQNQIDSFQAGGNRQGLNFQQVGSIRVPALDFQQQEAIGIAGRDAAHLVSALERLIAKKEAIKRGMMQQLLTGESRLPGFAEPWRKATVGELSEHHRRTVDPRQASSREFEHFSVPAFDDGELPAMELGSAIGSLKFEVPLGAVLVSKLNPRIPRTWAPGRIGGDAIASTEFVVLTPKTGIHRSFLKWQLRSAQVVGRMKTLATGTTGSHVRIHPRQIFSIEVMMPPEDEQIAIAKALDEVDREISLLGVRLVKARDIRQGMMQELLTGRTRLPLAEAPT
jgi:type I restriction enzyme, S subunit